MKHFRTFVKNRKVWTVALCTALVFGVLLSLPTSPSFASRSLQSGTSQDKGGEPTKESAPPIEEPTKAPLPDEHTQPEKTATPLPGQEPTKAPTLAEVAKTPTWAPSTPTIVAPTDAPETAAEPTAVATRTPEHSIDPVRVIGVVFDDANGSGQRDPDEPGLPGVPVMAESDPDDSLTTITDASGTYRVYALPDSTVRVVPPAGWCAPGLAALPASTAGDFPLRKLEGAATTTQAEAVTAPQVATVTQSVLDFSGMAIGFAALGVLVWVALLAHRRAIVRSFESWALADLRLRHEAVRESRQFAVDGDDQALVLLEQVALDATGARPNITHLVRNRTRIAPVAAIVAFSSETARHWVFSPATPDQMRRAARDRDRAQTLFGREGWRSVKQRHAIDALNSSPFVADNLAAVLRYLVNDSTSPLPRTEQWHVYVVEPPKKRER